MYSESFRAGLISLMMYDKAFLSQVAPDIKPRYFDNKIEQHVVRAIVEHFREHGKAPKKAVVLERVMVYLNTSRSSALSGEDVADYLESAAAMKTEMLENRDFVKSSSMKFCKQMALRDAIIEAADLLEKGEDLDRISEIMKKASRVGTRQADNGLFLLAARDEDDALVEEPRKPIPTGLPWIDKHCRGGLAQKELGLIVAPPHTGKTTGLVCIGAGMTLQGYPGVHFTCEMGKGPIAQMYRRNVTKRSDIELEKLSEEERQVMKEWMRKVRKRLKADVHIAEFPTNRLSIEGIVSYITMLESEHDFHPKWIIVDYVDILERPRHIKEDHLQREWLTQELRALAFEFCLPVWSASQVNAIGSGKQTAMMTDISGAFAKNMIVDIMIGFNQTVKEQQEDMLRTFWMKNRAGRKFMTDTLITDFDRSRFEMP